MPPLASVVAASSGLGDSVGEAVSSSGSLAVAPSAASAVVSDPAPSVSSPRSQGAQTRVVISSTTTAAVAAANAILHAHRRCGRSGGGCSAVAIRSWFGGLNGGTVCFGGSGAVSRSLGAVRHASANAVAEAQRSAGSLARALRITAAVSSGTPSIGGGSVLRCPATTVFGSAASKGGRPVRHS